MVSSVGASQVALEVKNLPADAEDLPWVRKIPGGGHGNLLHYSCLYNPEDRGAWGLQSMGSTRVGDDWSNLALLPVPERQDAAC